MPKQPKEKPIPKFTDTEAYKRLAQISKRIKQLRIRDKNVPRK